MPLIQLRGAKYPLAVPLQGLLPELLPTDPAVIGSDNSKDFLSDPKIFP